MKDIGLRTYFFKPRSLSEATFTMRLVIKYNLFSSILCIHFMHFKHLDYSSALPSVRKCGVSWILHMLFYNVFMIMQIHTSSFLSQVSFQIPTHKP